jgi:hypothetical protein
MMAEGVISPKSVLKLTVGPAHIQNAPSQTDAFIREVETPSAKSTGGSAARDKKGSVSFGGGGGVGAKAGTTSKETAVST